MDACVCVSMDLECVNMSANVVALCQLSKWDLHKVSTLGDAWYIIHKQHIQ